MKALVTCPYCGKEVPVYRNPLPTVDLLIRVDRGVLLIKRKNPPHGWALPGGFIDYGESAEHAAVREAREETSLEVIDLKQFHVYSEPDRDPRHHTLTVVFTARALGAPRAADDAAEIGVFTRTLFPMTSRSIMQRYLKISSPWNAEAKLTPLPSLCCNLV